MNRDYIMQNLHGLKPIDWEQAKADFAISGFEPDKLNIVPRDNVMLSLVDVAENVPTEVLLADWHNTAEPATDEARQLRALARNYVILSKKEARLPKFSKWVSSMFQSDQKLMVALSSACQAGAKPDDAGIIISCNPVDILRGAEGPHFWSCLGHEGGFREVLSAVVTRCPGIAVAYTNAPDGKMKCRVWLNHTQVDGKDTISLLNPYGNGFTALQVAKLIASKGYDVYEHGNGQANPKFINGFADGERIHWDIIEFYNGARRIAEAQCEPKKMAA